MVSAGNRSNLDPQNEWVGLFAGYGSGDSLQGPDHIVGVVLSALGNGDEGEWFEGEARCLAVPGGVDAVFGIQDGESCWVPDGQQDVTVLFGQMNATCSGPRERVLRRHPACQRMPVDNADRSLSAPQGGSN